MDEIEVKLEKPKDQLDEVELKTAFGTVTLLCVEVEIDELKGQIKGRIQSVRFDTDEFDDEHQAIKLGLSPRSVVRVNGEYEGMIMGKHLAINYSFGLQLDTSLKM